MEQTSSKTDLIALSQLLGCSITEISEYDELPNQNTMGLQSLKNKLDIKNVIQSLNDIVDKNKDIVKADDLKSIKKVLIENKHLETANRTLQKSCINSL